MQLEGSNVFRGYAVQRFINKVSELSSVVSVSVDGPLGHVANFKILSEANGQRTRSSFVRRHEVLSRCLRLIEKPSRSTRHDSSKAGATKSASVTIGLIVKRQRKLVATIDTIAHRASPRQRIKRMTKNSRRSRSKTFERPRTTQWTVRRDATVAASESLQPQKKNRACVDVVGRKPTPSSTHEA